MNKKVGIVLIVLVIAVLTFSVIAFTSSSLKIRYEIAKANYCEQKSDCVQVDSKCPFGCWIFVNSNEAERISEMIQGYESECVYSCLALESYDCIDSKCVVN